MFLSKLDITKVIIFFFLCSNLTYAQKASSSSSYIDYPYTQLDSLMYAYYGNGAYAECVLLMEAGREKARIEFGDQDSVFAVYTSNLAAFLQQTGEYDRALKLSIQALELDEKKLGKMHKNYAESLNNLALLYQKMAVYDKALPLALEVIAIEEKTIGENASFATSLNNLALLYSKMGHYAEALPIYIRAQKIYGKTVGEEHPSYANALNNLAQVYEKMGDIDKALQFSIQAKDTRKIALGEGHPLYAQSLSYLATLYVELKDFETALPLSTKSIDILEKSIGKQHPFYATSINNLAGLNFEIGNKEGALEYFLEALKLREATLGKKHPQYAGALNNVASTIQALGRYSEALPFLQEALEIRKAALGNKHYFIINSLNNLISLHQAMGNYPEAWKYWFLSIETAAQFHISREITQSWKDSLLNTSYLSNAHIESLIQTFGFGFHLLQLDSSIQNPRSKQIILADLSSKLLEKIRNEVSSEKDKLRTLVLSEKWLQKSLMVLDPKKNAAKAFEFADQNKSVLLLQATKSERAYQIGALPDSLIWKDKKLLKKSSQLKAKLLERRSEESKKRLLIQLNKVQQDIDDLVQVVKKEYPNYYHFKYDPIKSSTKDIQAILDPASALIEYVISDTILHIFYIDQQQQKWIQHKLDKTILNKKIKDFHNILSNFQLLVRNESASYEQLSDLSFWMYQNLIAPIAGELGQIQNLTFVTDGALGHLPFEAFLVEQAPQKITPYSQLHFLIQDYTISYNYAAALWKENKEKVAPKNNGQLFAMAGNYAIQLDKNKQSNRLPSDRWLRSKLDTLPAAREEVIALKKEFEGFFAFDKQASEKVIKANVSDYAVLHFAMHGILDNKRPVLSSLACTEDSDSSESNFLQAHEISKLHLNANLVVLSACETGYGRFEKGNGMASLARSFMYAGAPSLIVTLWQVNDYATSEIMKKLYSNLAKGMNIDEALRKAKLHYMQSSEGILAHPAFWSPFVQIGNTKAIHISKKKNYLAYGITIGLFLFLGISVLIWRRRKEA